MSAARRALILLAGVAALAATALLLPLHAVPAAVTGLGPAAPVIGVVVGAVLLVALVPRTPISFACGLLFGAWAGTACAIVTFVLAAVATFAGGRLLGRAFFARLAERTFGSGPPSPRAGGGKLVGLAGRRLGYAWHRLDDWTARSGMLAVATVRSLPVAPYGLVGYAYGTSAVRARDYLVGTVLAGIPSAVVYAFLGAAVAGGGSTGLLTAVPTVVSAVLVVTLVVRSRRSRRSGGGPATGRPDDPGTDEVTPPR